MKRSVGIAGWLTAALLAVFVGASGFQDSQSKTGIVDLNKIVTQSNLGAQNRAKLEAAVDIRSDLIEFANTYRVLTTEQANRLRELWIKPNATEAEKQELERIKAAVIESDRKRSELAQKETLTDADREMLRDFSNRVQMMQTTLQRWNNEFDAELRQLTEQLTNETVAAAKEAVRNVAAQQGYSIVFESAVAPYAANDITDAAMRSMNGG